MFRIVRDIPVSSAHAQTPSCCRLGAEATILKDRSHHGTTENEIGSEEYFCNYGVNEDYQQRFQAAGLRVSATGTSGEIRAVERHPHFRFSGRARTSDA